MIKGLIAASVMYIIGLLSHYQETTKEPLNINVIDVPRFVAVICASKRKKLYYGGMILQWFAVGYIIGVLYWFFQEKKMYGVVRNLTNDKDMYSSGTGGIVISLLLLGLIIGIFFLIRFIRRKNKWRWLK